MISATLKTHGLGGCPFWSPAPALPCISPEPDIWVPQRTKTKEVKAGGGFFEPLYQLSRAGQIPRL